MSQSIIENYLHIVFSTKDRKELIDEAIEEELYAYIGGVCNKLGCSALKVGGYINHIHILCKHSEKITLMKFMELLKSNTSKWIKTKGDNYANFYWQDGYGSFSTDKLRVDQLTRYIANQKEHHSQTDFKEEYLTLLHEAQSDYDERYLWK